MGIYDSMGSAAGPMDDYEKGQVLGKGSTSLVFDAVRKADGERVAIKETKMFELPEEKRERCLKEVQLLQCLHHPNIVALEDSFLTEHHLVLVLEYAGGDLRQLIEKQRAAGFLLLERHVWGLFSQLTGALRYMHSKRIMHRDLKPSNVLVTTDGLKMGDLGLGRQFSSQTHEAFSKVGTPYYVSPEVVGGAGYDFKSDVWSMGCMLYELATLQNPFESDGATLASVFSKIIKADFVPLEGEHSDVLRELVARMLSVKPDNRPGMAEVDQIACRQYLHILDQEGDVMLGDNPSPLEALAQQIIPRPTQPRTQAEDAMDIAAGLPTGLPVISEMLPMSLDASLEPSRSPPPPFEPVPLPAPSKPPAPPPPPQSTSPPKRARPALGAEPVPQAKSGCCVIA